MKEYKSVKILSCTAASAAVPQAAVDTPVPFFLQCDRQSVSVKCNARS